MKRSKRLFVLAILVLTMTLSACTTPDGTPGGKGKEPNDNATSVTQDASSVSETGEGKEVENKKTDSKESFTITYGIFTGTMEDGMHDNFSAMNELEAQTGVKIDIVNLDEDKFRLLASGQDLPDIFHMGDASMAQTLMESKSVMGLNELIKSYAPNVAKEYDMSIRYQATIFDDTYFLPINQYDEPTENQIAYQNSNNSLFARYDIYKEIGSPEITNANDGFLDVLEEMQVYAREKYGDENIYCFTSYTDQGLNPYMIPYPQTRGYGNLSDVNQLVGADNNDLQDCFLKEDGVFWDGIQFFNEAYRRGLFEPEGFTQKYQQYSDKVEAGKILVSYNCWTQPNRDEFGQQAVNVILPGSVENQLMLTAARMPMGNRFDKALAVNTNCKYPEKVMEMLNWTNSTVGARTLWNGVQGEIWDYVDDTPQFIGEFKDLLEGGNWNSYFDDHPSGAYGSVAFALWDLCSFGPYAIGDDGYPVNLLKTAEVIYSVTFEGQKEFAKDYYEDCKYPGEVYYRWVEEGLMKNSDTYLTIPAQLLGTVPEDVAVIESKAREYFQANVSKVIMASDDAEFAKAKEEIIKGMKDLNLETASEAVGELFKVATDLAGQFE